MATRWSPGSPCAFNALDGGGIVPATKPQPDGTLVKVLARACRC
jgi:hypothetical protein